MRNAVDSEGALLDGVVYIGNQRSPKMNPTGKHLPRSIWHNRHNKAFRNGEITREESLERYERDVRENPELVAQLPELAGKTLACWCAGKEGTPEVLTADDNLFCHG